MTLPTVSRRQVLLCAGALALAGCGSVRMPVAKPSAPLVTPAAPVLFKTFAMEPFEGVPGNPADSLTARMVSASGTRAARVTLNPVATVDFRLRGHMTAVASDAIGTVIYHFDVFDLAGNRVHRITGQESSGGSSGDPWSGVSSTTLNNIANRSLDALSAWVGRAS